MANTRKHLFLTLAALTLISGCDDSGSSTETGWLDWITGKDGTNSSQIGLTGAPSDYIRETQAGNYLAGQFAQYRQDWKTAHKYIDKVITLDPTNVDLQQRAMILSMQAGDATRAILFARKVLQEDQKNMLALMFIAVDEIARQDYSEAARTLSKMPESGIVDFIRPILIAWSQAPEKKVDLDALIAGGPLHAYHALLIADYLGTVQDADKYFINVLTGGGADIHVLEMMADVYNRQGKKELAQKIYDTLITQYEGGIGTVSRLKLLEQKRNNPEFAQGNRIQTPAQGAAESFYNMARILSNDQSEDSALVFTRIAEYLDPGKDDIKLLLARMMIKSDHVDDAIALFKSIRSDSPGYLEAQRTAAELLEQENQIDESISFLEHIYQTDKDVNALIQIGDVYRRAERHQEAIKAYDRAVDALGGKISSDQWNILYARGMSYERTGNMKKAEEDLEAALEFKPDHPYLLNYLGYSWADQGKKLDKALKLVEKAANLKPEDGYIIDSLGWVYYKMGKYEDAAAQLEKAVELIPYDSTINDHLGDAYWRVGRKNEARFQWQRAFNSTKDEKIKTDLTLKISEGLTDQKPDVMEAKTLKTDAPVKN